MAGAHSSLILAKLNTPHIAALGFFQIMREVHCSTERGKSTVFISTLIILIFVGGPLWMVYGLRHKISAAYFGAHWLEVAVAVVLTLFALFITIKVWRALFLWLLMGVREWFSEQDWVIEVTPDQELNFQRPEGTFGESYLIKVSEISAVIKETELGTMDTCDTTSFFVVSKDGHKFMFDDFIPFDLDNFFQELVKEHPSIDYREIET